MATLKKELREILEKYGINPQDKSQLWDCHGTLVLYHKAYEIIAAKEKIVFDAPVIIEGKALEKVVSLVVTGRMGERSEWSFGEAAPANLKSTYPYAMAEKRAKDRVIAKLVGLAQYVYSEDEAEDFKTAKPEHTANSEEPQPKQWTPEDKAIQAEIITRINLCADQVDLDALIDETGRLVNDLPAELSETVQMQISNKFADFKNGVKADLPKAHKFPSVDAQRSWVARMLPVIKGMKSLKMLEDWKLYNSAFIMGLSDKGANDKPAPRAYFLGEVDKKAAELKNVDTLNTPIG